MKKFPAAASVFALLVAGCSGHNGSSMIPSGGMPDSATHSSGTQSVAAAAPSGWAATATRGLTTLQNVSDLGPLSASAQITVRLGLQLRNADALKSAVAHGVTVSDGAFLSSYAPAPAQVSAVEAYLRSKGFSNIVAEPNNLLISATGTAAQTQSAFDTTLHSFSQNGKNVYANVAPAFVPKELAGVVIAVLGLNDIAAVKTGPKVQPCIGSVSDPCVRNYDPITFRVTYDATDLDGNVSNSPAGDSDDTAYNTPVAIMAEGNVTQSITDLRTNEKAFKLPQVPVYVKQVGIPSPDTAGDGEWTLDMTYSSGIAGRVKALYLYATTSLTDSDIALEYNHWVTDHLTNIGNSSFGGCELFPYLDGSMLVDDEMFLEGASHGQTMFASTGDSGGFCSVGVPNGVPGGAPFVEYPATSPYVVAVGGTDLFSNADGSYKGETGWEAGGGGISQFEYSPYWEAEAQPISAQGQNFRGAPDIAMDASLETGALLYGGSAANGACTPCITGGTSLSSPLAAGAWAIMQTQHNNSLGFAPPRLYKIYAQNPTAVGPIPGPPPTQKIGGYHDILLGNNGNPLDTAAPRYDYITGLGSFDVLATNKIIGNATP
jgi:subtilase family serine protease